MGGKYEKGEGGGYWVGEGGMGGRGWGEGVETMRNVVFQPSTTNQTPAPLIPLFHPFPQI